MHLYLFARGVKHQVELWEALMQSQFFKWRRVNLQTGQEEIEVVQGALRKSIFGLYEYVFPKEAFVDVLAMLQADGSVGIGRKSVLINMKNSTLRRMIGIKKIPKKYLKEAEEKPAVVGLNNSERVVPNVSVPHVATHLVGYLEDEYKQMPEWNYAQEML